MFRHHQIEDNRGNRIYMNTENDQKFDARPLISQGDADYDFERIPPGWTAFEEDSQPCGETDAGETRW